MVFIVLGFEFLGILLLLLYSTGIAVVFIIISMSLGTQHNYVLKNETIQEEFYDDKYITDRNNIIYTLMYYLFLVSTFFIIDFFFDSSFNFLGILSSSSFAGILSVKFLTNLNDILLIGVLVFQQHYLHTTLVGILLLVSLVSSICVAE
jgi:NADH:ubiquinone oxidoreductase subunit 6 (subunit J)